MEEVVVLAVRSFSLFLLVLFYFVTVCEPLTAGLDFLVSETVSQAQAVFFPRVQ